MLAFVKTDYLIAKIKLTESLNKDNNIHIIIAIFIRIVFMNCIYNKVLQKN